MGGGENCENLPLPLASNLVGGVVLDEDPQEPDVEREKLILELAEEALELESAQRSAFLQARCGNDPELLRQVQALLSEDGNDELRIVAPTVVPPNLGAHGEGEVHVSAPEYLELIGRLDRTAALFDRYRLDRLLGEGSSSWVHQAFDRDLGRDVAIKRLQRNQTDTKQAARFVQEAQILAKIDHPNIPPGS